MKDNESPLDSNDLLDRHDTPKREAETDAQANRLAKRFHELYEELAPQFNYKTRRASAVVWEQVPENNKRLMTEVCKRILQEKAV